MTSGNLSEEPIARDNGEARVRLGRIADFFLLHDREILARCDDSVFVVVGQEPRPVRRARGFAPNPILCREAMPQVLACGASEKNTFCLTRGRHAFVSQHVGDMENLETQEHFAGMVDLYRRMFRVEPEAVAHDIHPDYLSTRWAREHAACNGLPQIGVQHHHAHVASCMAENRAAGPVIGVAFDGTGLGTDGAIWGGEFLIVSDQGFTRAGHLEYVRLPGGEAAIRKPWRMALSYLAHALGPDGEVSGTALDRVGGAHIETVRRQIEHGFNSPLTSSAGRLFDGVAALVDVRLEAQYEAQAAVELEVAAWRAFRADETGEPYPFEVERGEPRVVRLAPLVHSVLADVRSAVPVPVIALRFHVTMSEILCRVVEELSRDTGIRTVALSGGVFQNRLLCELTEPKLRQCGYEVLVHKRVPCNDGGISLGQAVVAARELSLGRRIR